MRTCNGSSPGRLTLSAGGLLALLGLCPGTDAGEVSLPTPSPDAFARDVAPVLAKHCLACHGAEKHRGNLSFDGIGDAASARKAPAVWTKVARRLQAGEMPPRGRPKPDEGEVGAVLGWIERDLSAAGPRDPGRVTLRRLNRIEYRNTVLDLLGVDYKADEVFPSDDVGNGFDSMGDVLSLPPLLLEKYLAAAEKIARQALALGSESRRRLLGPEGKFEPARLREVLEGIASRGWRRPAARGEIDRLAALADSAAKAGVPEDGLRVALEAVLASPHFVFRVEIDPRPEDPVAAHPLSDHELAVRLSYFIWSSMPDDALFARAQSGELHRPEVLESETRRLLVEPRARSLVEDFGCQWLQIRNLRNVGPDPARFRAFDDELRASMLAETERFLETVLREDRSVLELIDSDWTYVDERLARLYGIPGVKGNELRRVQVPRGRRGGVITQASVLTVTSNPTRTSPVKRGKWVLEVLFNAAPPPPPAGVGDLEATAPITGATLRERMEKHRADPSCATCHQGMDPIGFGLESFDAIGAWRDKEEGKPIDLSGTLPDGRSFQGPGELKRVLLGDSDRFRRCLVEKMMTYALGRGLEPANGPAVEAVRASLAAAGDRFSALVIGIVMSEPFRMRRGERGTP